METETKEIPAWQTFGVWLFLMTLTVASCTVLIFYFSGVWKLDYTKGERMAMGFGVGFLISLVIAGIATWRATREPSDEREDEEAEDEEE